MSVTIGIGIARFPAPNVGFLDASRGCFALDRSAGFA